jgi:hypothetical protein
MIITILLLPLGHISFTITNPSQTHSPEVDYSLFMAVSMVLMSERLEKHPRATPVAFSPPIFTRTTFVFVFRVFPPPPLGNAKGGLYIGVFRSS